MTVKVTKPAINLREKLSELEANTGIERSPAPSSATSKGSTGDIAWDDGYIYICTATDTWKRVAVATW